MVRVAECHGEDHLSLAEPFGEFFVGEEDVSDPEAADAHGGGLECHVLGCCADGLDVAQFMDLVCRCPFFFDVAAVRVDDEYDIVCFFHAFEGEACVGVEVRTSCEDAFAFFGAFDAFFHEGEHFILALASDDDEFPWLAVLCGRCPHACAEDFSHIYFGDRVALEESDTSSLEDHVVHTISTFHLTRVHIS